MMNKDVKINNEEKKDKREFVLKYVNISPTFTYGLDELMNALQILNLDMFDGDSEVDEAIELIKEKRVRFLRSQLANPTLKPHQIRGIELALGYEGDSKPKQAFSFNFTSNIEEEE